MISRNLVLSEASIQAYILAFAIFLLMKPVFIWPFLIVATMLAGAALFLSIFLQKRVFRKNILLAILVFSMLVFYKFLQGASAFGIIFFAVSSSLIVLIDESVLFKSFLHIKRLLAVIIFMGGGLWVLHLLTGDSSLFFIGYLPDQYILSESKVEAGSQYALYPFSTRIVYNLVSEFYRFQSIFDEPGYIGTTLALILTIDKCSLKGITNKILFVGGLISLSLAFYVIFFVYYVAYLAPKPIKFLKVIFLAFIIALSLYSTDTGEAIVDKFLIERLYIQDGKFSGNNRAGGLLNQQFNYFLDKASLKEKVFGLHNYKHDGSSSIKQIPIKTGYLGVFLISSIFLAFIFFYRSRVNYASLVFMMVFFLSAFQRPGIVDPEYIYLFIVGIALMGRPRRSPGFIE